MGAYLSQPVTKKVSSDGKSEHLAYGDSTMQGWRVSQEDAHNSLPDLVPGCALFAVYDGHGGHEVATYTAHNLPDHIGKNALYAAGQVREGLRQAFLDFDQTLTRADVIDELKVIAGRDPESDEEEEEAEREVDELFQEAHMPLEELMAKYGNKPANADAVRLKKKDKPLSPFLKAKAGSSGAGSSSKVSTDAGESSCSVVEPVQKNVTEELEDAKAEAESLGSSEETDAKSETKAESLSKSDAEEEAESSTKSEDNTESNANSKTEAEPCTKSDQGTEAEPCAKSDKESESSTKSEPEADVIAKSESKSESDVKSVTDVKSNTTSEAEADSGGKLDETDAKSPTKSAMSVETSEVKLAVDTKTETIHETKQEADSKSDAKCEADAKSKANVDADIPPEAKTNGAGGGDSLDSPSAKKTPAGAARGGGGDGDGDEDEVVSPSCNGTGNGTTKSSATRRGKGARPGSGKAPAGRQQAAAPARATRKMPERAAAEIYRGVLAGARLAKEAGHGDDGDNAEAEEEEEADEDFSMEQSDNIEDDDDADGSEEDEEEEEEEEAEEEDSEQDDEDEDGCDEEDGDFMLNMKDEPGSDSGCTAVVALLHGRQLYVANVGDSRCVLSRSGRAVDMSSDHKPEDAPELQRIVKAGGKVTMDGRVNGGLNLSRAFGDHAYKADKSLQADQQMISASPDVRCVTVEPDTDEFMVLACDGIWNSKKSQEVVDFVSERIRERGETQLSKICEELFDECLATNTMGDGTGCDNMTCIIVRFLPSLATVEAPAPTPTPASDAGAAAATQRPADEAEDQPPEKRQRTE